MTSVSDKRVIRPRAATVCFDYSSNAVSGNFRIADQSGAGERRGKPRGNCR